MYIIRYQLFEMSIYCLWGILHQARLKHEMF